MLTHIVLFKLHDPTSTVLEEAKGKMLQMQGRIPGLLGLEVGLDVLHSKRSFDIALIAKFSSLQDLQAYQVHPLHMEVAAYMTAIRESSVAVDYQD